MSYLGYTTLMTKYLTLFENPKVLEIGIDRGQSTLPLVHNLTCVTGEHFRPAGGAESFKYVGVDVRRDDCLNNQLVSMFGVDLWMGVEGQEFTPHNPNWNVATIKENSLNFLPELAASGWVFDLVLIDGDHNYPTVTKELSYLDFITHDASLVVADDYSTRWAERDGFYKDYKTHEDNEVLTKPEAHPSKKGVKQAIDDWILQNQEWNNAPLTCDSSVLHKKKTDLAIKEEGYLFTAGFEVRIPTNCHHLLNESMRRQVGNGDLIRFR